MLGYYCPAHFHIIIIDQEYLRLSTCPSAKRERNYSKHVYNRHRRTGGSMIMVGGHLNDQGRKGGEGVGGIASVLIASHQNPLWKLMISTVR